MPPTPPVIVPVGDLHCGSLFALCPPDFPRRDGFTHGLSKTQQWIWDCWRHFNTDWLPSVLDGRPYILVLMGDLTEGLHHSNAGELVEAMTSTHINIAMECLRPLASKAQRVYCLRGTHCHVGDAEDAIGKALGAVRDPETDSHSAFKWQFEVHGTLCSFQHHTSTTSRMALAHTAHGVQLAEEQLQAARAGRRPPQVVCRAHRHVYGHAGDDRALSVTGPSWQVKTGHAHKVVPASLSSIGAYALDFAGVRRGAPPAVRPCVYRPEEE